VTCSLTLIRSLIGRRWSMFDVVNKNVQTKHPFQHLQTFSIKTQTSILLQCTNINIMMYRNGTSRVPKSYYKKTHVPKLISYVPKSSCTETVHPLVLKLSCTENDLTRINWLCCATLQWWACTSRHHHSNYYVTSPWWRYAQNRLLARQVRFIPLVDKRVDGR